MNFACPRACLGLQRVAAIAFLIFSICAHADRVPMYRSYNIQYNDFLYTVSWDTHVSAIVNYGYSDNGIAFWVDDIQSQSTVPFNRYFIGYPQVDHFYTVSPSDEAYVLANGWSAEGHEGFMYPSSTSRGAANDGAIPIYRLHQNNHETSDLAHYYTRFASDVSEWQAYGWTYDGIAGYAYGSADPPGGYKAAILTYHSGTNDQSCNSYQNSHFALATDLQTLRAQNFKVMPLRTVAQWAAGQISSAGMPARFVAITVDDGSPKDISYSGFANPCGNASFYDILKSEWLADQSLPPSRRLFAAQSGPLATAFVIASPTIRSLGNSLAHLGGDGWWGSTNAETNPKVLEIQNHSTDHEGHVGSGPIYEYAAPFYGIPLNIGGLYDGVYGGNQGLMFCRIGSGPQGYTSADREVRLAAAYIDGKTHVWPDMFAVPVGAMSVGLFNYLNDPNAGHSTSFAFLGGNRHVQAGGAHRYSIPRFVHLDAWSSPNDFLQLLFDYVDPNAPRNLNGLQCPNGL